MYGYGNGWGMMGDGYGSMGGISMVFWLLALVLLAGGVVLFMRSSPSIGLGRQAAAGRTSGLDLLEQRYARDEIMRDEYLRKKRRPESLTTIARSQFNKAKGRR